MILSGNSSSKGFQSLDILTTIPAPNMAWENLTLAWTWECIKTLCLFSFVPVKYYSARSFERQTRFLCLLSMMNSPIKWKPTLSNRQCQLPKNKPRENHWPPTLELLYYRTLWLNTGNDSTRCNCVITALYLPAHRKLHTEVQGS